MQAPGREAEMQVGVSRILCPIDFSEFSRRALELSVTVARWYDAEVKALHVLPIAVPATPLAAVPVQCHFQSSLQTTR
jgi:nucleotide-binding universal stress UspA family protein